MPKTIDHNLDVGAPAPHPLTEKVEVTPGTTPIAHHITYTGHEIRTLLATLEAMRNWLDMVIKTLRDGERH